MLKGTNPYESSGSFLWSLGTRSQHGTILRIPVIFHVSFEHPLCGPAIHPKTHVYLSSLSNMISKACLLQRH